MPSNSGFDELMHIRNEYLILRYSMSDIRLLVVNWMDRKYFQIKLNVGAKMLHP